MVLKFLSGGALALALLPAVAAAAPITRTINFVAGPFVGANNTVPPFATVTGSFTLTYDPDQVGSQGDIVVNALSIPFSGSARYSVFGGNTLGIGTTDYFNFNTGTFTGVGVNGFAGTFTNLDAAPGVSMGTFNYSQVGYQDRASTRNVLGTNAIAGVPEPATWAMLMLGFGGIGAGLRHRPRTHRRPAAA